MGSMLFQIFTIFLIFFTIVDGFGFINSDAGLSTTELLKKYKYPVETHQVQTEDRYILTMYRIPGKSSSKPPVLLMHGVFCSSAVWLTLGPQRSLAYRLYDNGYDVWLGNQRGSVYSRKHINLDPKTNAKQFFNYSFHEIGLYDVRAKVDYILGKTGQSKIIYVGHTQGITDAFVLTSERPEYNDKFLLLLGLSPVAYMTYAPSPIFRALSYVKDILELNTNLLGIYEVFTPSKLITQFKIYACSPLSPFREICAWGLFLIGGIDSEQQERDRLSVMYTAVPGPCSTREFYHYLQAMQSSGFNKYDFGRKDNLKIYRQEKPPSYNITKITAPVLLYHGQNDWLADVKDVERLAAELPNLKEKKLLDFKKANHFDVIWAKDINKLLNDDVILKLEKIVNNS